MCYIHHMICVWYSSIRRAFDATNAVKTVMSLWTLFEGTVGF